MTIRQSLQGGQGTLWVVSSSKSMELCTAFEKLMKDEFHMSSMGELTFFLGLHNASTPVNLEKPLVKDGDADDVDVHLYRSMIRDSPFELVAYTDSDYAGATQDKKSTTGGYQFLGNRHLKRGRDTKIPQSSGPPVKVGNEAVHKELDDRMERVATTASRLKAEQDSVHTLGSGEDNMKVMEFMAHCTKLSALFWQTASTSTLEDREVKITATIDGQLKTITEASLRRHLKLEDADGISSLPNSKNFEQLALMRFIQILFNKHQRLLLPHKRTYVAPTLIQKLFNNMRRVSKGYTGVNIQIFSNMFVQGPIQQGKGSTVPVESHHILITTPSTSQPPLSSPSRVPTPPHDSPLPGGHTPGSDEGSMTLTELTVLCTQLVKKLEHKVKSRQPRRRARVVISDTEEDLEDPSKQGRRIAEIDQNPSISLVQDEGTLWIQKDAEIQGRASDETEILLDQEEPTELVGDLGSGEKGEKEISTANISVSTTSATPEVSTTAANLVYIKRSAEKRKDKGKAILKDDESVQKKSKKQLEQERLGHEEAIRLQEHINEEERQRIARDVEIAKQLQEEFDRARQEQEVVAEAYQAHDIDWSDPAILRFHTVQNRSFSKAEVRKNMCIYLKNQGGYKQSHFKGMKYEDIRPIFERVWDQNQSFVPMDYELEVQRLKREGQDVVEEPAKRQRTEEALGSVQEQTCEEPKAEELSQEQLHQMIMEIYSEDTRKYWKIIRVGGHTEAYQTFDDMLKKFDRDDLDKLWNLVKERFRTTEPTEDKARELWVELKRGHDIYMLVEKDYPLTKALATLMLCNKLRVDQYSDMADELLHNICHMLMDQI
ncbi:hypothetical protein Tco_0015614 [Tanacetum coccineum]